MVDVNSLTHLTHKLIHLFILFLTASGQACADCFICQNDDCPFHRYALESLDTNATRDKKEGLLAKQPETQLLQFLAERLKYGQNKKSDGNLNDFTHSRLKFLDTQSNSPLQISGTLFQLNLCNPNMPAPSAGARSLPAIERHTSFTTSFTSLTKTLPTECCISPLTHQALHDCVLSMVQAFINSPSFCINLHSLFYTPPSNAFLLSAETWEIVATKVLTILSPRFLSCPVYTMVTYWEETHLAAYQNYCDESRATASPPAQSSLPYLKNSLEPPDISHRYHSAWHQCYQCHRLLEKMALPDNFRGLQLIQKPISFWEIEPDDLAKLNSVCRILQTIESKSRHFEFRDIFPYAYTMALHLEFIFRIDLSMANCSNIGSSSDLAVAVTLFTLYELFSNEFMNDPTISLPLKR